MESKLRSAQLTQPELSTLVDWHDQQEAEAEATGHVESENYHKERAQVLRHALLAAPRRAIRDVIAQLLPLIPVDTPNEDDDYTELKQDLERCAGEWYRAPEIEEYLWVGVASSLDSWLDAPPRSDALNPEPWPEWKYRILKVFTGQPHALDGIYDGFPCDRCGKQVVRARQEDIDLCDDCRALPQRRNHE